MTVKPTVIRHDAPHNHHRMVPPASPASQAQEQPEWQELQLVPQRATSCADWPKTWLGMVSDTRGYPSPSC